MSLKLRGKGQQKVARVIFDTGAAVTQVDTTFIELLGYSARDAHDRVRAHGPAGPIQEGYAVKVDSVEVLGKVFSAPEIAVYDFDNFGGSGIRGLLGFDLIQQLHLEMDGPLRELLVFE